MASMPVKPPWPEMCVLSGAGGSVAAARGSGSTARLRSSMLSSSCLSGLASAGASSARRRSSSSSSLVSRTARRPATDASPSAASAGRPALRERRQACQEGVEPGGGGAQVAQHGLLGGGELAQPQHVRIELAQEAREPVERGGQLAAARGRHRRGAARLAHEARHVAPAPWRARRRRCPRASHDPLDGPGLAGQYPQRLGGLPQPGVRAPQRGAEVVRPAGEPRAELADDEPQAVGVWAANDVVHQVERDRRAGLGHGHAPAVGKPLARAAGLAVHEVLADERLRPDLAVRVAAEVGEARLGDLDLHDARADAARRSRPRGRSSCPPGRRRP